jgi:hypothetical protein
MRFFQEEIEFMILVADSILSLIRDGIFTVLGRQAAQIYVYLPTLQDKLSIPP